jgi:tetratricopeptide (TPR) repeat protein
VGRPEEAHRLLVAARDRALAAPGLPSEQRAWFHLRVGDLALRYGRLAEARRELEAGLAAAPNDHRVLGALARLEAVRHRWRRAVEYGERAIAIALDPATLGLVGDGYAALGDTVKAEEYYRALEVSIAGQPGPYHRAWSLFLLDHGRRIPEVLGRVTAELGTRRDIYGYDLLAWALHRSGRDAEAEGPMRRALALGTRDPMLWYHAGAITRALGRREDARRYLRAALALNPRWHWSEPERARALLEDR